ncbi:hypothetical protein KPATCC21470_1760 [Kitasatospora purpeofusca]
MTGGPAARAVPPADHAALGPTARGAPPVHRARRAGGPPGGPRDLPGEPSGHRRPYL